MKTTYINALTPLFLQRLFSGLASVLLSFLLVFVLYNSPVTGAFEAEMLRWRFEIQHKSKPRHFSKQIVIVYLNQERSDTNDVVPSLLEAIERDNPAVVGLDLPNEAIDSEHFRRVLLRYPNIVLGVNNDAAETKVMNGKIAGASALPANYRGSTNLNIEGNGMVAQLPLGLGAPGKITKRQSFCRVVASLYRAAKGKRTSISSSDEFRFINYGDVEFPAFDSRKVLSQDFQADNLRDKIVLIGLIDAAYIIPGDVPHIHKTTQASEVLVQAYATQTVLDRSAIGVPSQTSFQLMLYALALICFLMPIWSYGVRFLVFTVSLVLVLIGSCLAIIWAHVFVQLWPLLIGLTTSFIIGSIAYAISDLNEHNRRLRQTQTNLEKRNLELEAARGELEKRGKEIARAREVGMEEERKRIALDLHDDALKELFLASGAVDKMLGHGLDANLGAQVQDKLHEASDKIRRIMANLSPSALAVCGLTGAIEGLTDSLRQETHIEVSFHNQIAAELDSMDANQALLIYRIVQEAFNNIQKHSAATAVSVKMKVENAWLRIVITDNGIGMNGSGSRADSYGLQNMKYRADLIGANVSWVKPAEFQSGTQIDIVMPITPNPEAEPSTDAPKQIG